MMEASTPEATVLSLSLLLGAAAVLAALVSLAICYAGILASVVMGGDPLIMNPHLQAVLMWGMAFVAVLFLLNDRRDHRANLPLALGVLALVMLVVTLYLGYDERMEAIAYVLLVIATLINQNLLLSCLHAKVQAQASEIEDLNRQLASKVARQESEIGRLGRLKEFLAPQVAEIIVADDKDALLETHRRYIACLFCDIRNFTAVSEEVEPEDVIAILQGFHDMVGRLIAKHGGTIGFRSGDGLMVFFNDPIPCDDPVLRAMRLALETRTAFNELRAPWHRLGHDIGLGIGIASGYSTLGLVGLQGRADYTAIGGAVNVAARLCDAATDGQILVSQRAYLDVEEQVRAEPLGSLKLKGFAKPVEIVSLEGLSED